MKAKFEKFDELSKRQIRLDSSDVIVIGDNVRFEVAGEYPYGTLVLIRANASKEPTAVKYGDGSTYQEGDVFGIVSENQDIKVTEGNSATGHIYLSGVFARDAIEEVNGNALLKIHELKAKTQLMVFSKHI